MTSVAVELAERDEPADGALASTVLGPVGDQRRRIEYQPRVRLSLSEPGPCAGPLRPAIVTGSGHQFAEWFVERGYVVAHVHWRLPGYTNYLSPGSLYALLYAVNDLGVGVRWLRAHAEELCLHPDRVVGMGYSMEGITALALAFSEGEVAAGDVVDPDIAGGPAEVPDAVSEFGPPPTGPPTGLALYPGTLDAVVAFAGFALGGTIDAGEPPALLVHAPNDAMVPFSLSEETCAAADTVGVVCELIAHGSGHGVPEETFDAVDEFLTRILSGSAGD